MTKEFLKAFGVVIRDQVMMKKTVEISEIGTFKVVHYNQQQVQRVDGTTVMMPPKDAIEFTAEQKK
jgi:nucleoid DNA-binding protein